MSNVFEGTRFCIHTFGCQMNKHDSERVAGMLEGLARCPSKPSRRRTSSCS